MCAVDAVCGVRSDEGRPGETQERCKAWLLPSRVYSLVTVTHTHTHTHTHTRTHILNISKRENVIKFPKSRLGSEIQRREKSEWIREISHGGWKT